jgi:cell division protein FtsN
MSRSTKKNGAIRNNRSSSATEKSSRPAFLAGLVIGALVTYIMPSMLTTDQKPSQAAVQDIVKKTDEETLKFDFYTLLKDNEILVPDDQQTSEEANQTDSSHYLLQVASFKNAQDAENLKVELLLLNLTADSEIVTSQNGDVWHRVIVGPFANTSKMASARARLAQNDMDSLLLKRKL